MEHVDGTELCASRVRWCSRDEQIPDHRRLRVAAYQQGRKGKRSCASVRPSPGFKGPRPAIGDWRAATFHHFRNRTSCAGGRHNMPPPPASWPLTFWSWKWVSESRVTWATSAPILVFLGLSVLDLGPMYATETDVRQMSVAHHRLMPSLWDANSRRLHSTNRNL